MLWSETACWHLRGRFCEWPSIRGGIGYLLGPPRRHVAQTSAVRLFSNPELETARSAGVNASSGGLAEYDRPFVLQPHGRYHARKWIYGASTVAAFARGS